jgi:RES domain-containing protein
LTAWRQVSPSHGILDAPDPPIGEGRYHRPGGIPTWYGSSSEAGAWAEFLHNLPAGVDIDSARRRIGRATFEVVLLDLTDPEVEAALGVSRADLTAPDRSVCQQLAEIAVASGLEAVLGPSAAAVGETTLAVFGQAIKTKSRDVVDAGIRRPPRPKILTADQALSAQRLVPESGKRRSP